MTAQTQDEIMKGCGDISKGKIKGLTIITQCGNTDFKDSVCLCNVCRDKLEALKILEGGK